jgi:hypothetical protein
MFCSPYRLVPRAAARLTRPLIRPWGRTKRWTEGPNVIEAQRVTNALKHAQIRKGTQKISFFQNTLECMSSVLSL